MVTLYDGGVYLLNGSEILTEKEAEERAKAGKMPAVAGKGSYKEEAKKGTIAYSILEAHNTSGSMEKLKIRFDAMTSHDITYVGTVSYTHLDVYKRQPDAEQGSLSFLKKENAKI